MKNLLLLLLVFVFILSSCVSKSNVLFKTDVDGAEVFIDGESIGKTPVKTKLSNAIWKDPDILIKQDGYNDNYYTIEKDLKVANLVMGLILWWPTLLYVWGPDENQFVRMVPE